MHCIILVALAVLLAAAPAAAKDTVVIYTAIEPEQITVLRNEQAKTLTIAVDYTRTVRLFPSQKYSTLRFHTEKETTYP